jgi:hypothetical protein
VRRSSASSTSLTNSQRLKYAWASAGVIEAISYNINTQEVASLRGESSNQLLETLEEWNNYLERYAPLVL